MCLQCRGHGRFRFDPWVRKIPLRKAWQPTPVFLPGEFHGQKRLEGYSSWGCRELYMIEVTEHAHTHTNTHMYKTESLGYNYS